MRRRRFLAMAPALPGFVWLAGCGGVDPAVEAAAEADLPEPQQVTIVEFDSHGKRTGASTVPEVVKTRYQWQRELSDRTYKVLRERGTEFAFSGRYHNNHEHGIYRCAGCGTALFSSDSKFDSGTGWPSFWEPIAEENVYTLDDFSLGVYRQEVLCRRCGGHLGHVFPDGPEPTGLRYCINSAALRFEGT